MKMVFVVAAMLVSACAAVSAEPTAASCNAAFVNNRAALRASLIAQPKGAWIDTWQAKFKALEEKSKLNDDKMTHGGLVACQIVSKDLEDFSAVFRKALDEKIAADEKLKKENEEKAKAAAAAAAAQTPVGACIVKASATCADLTKKVDSGLSNNKLPMPVIMQLKGKKADLEFLGAHLNTKSLDVCNSNVEKLAIENSKIAILLQGRLPQ